ncbi:MAG: TRAP transporter substrate-binding protein DctP [Alphaproteobacteria bacterium]
MKRSIKLLTAAAALSAGLVASAGVPTPASAQTKILVHIFAPATYPNNLGWNWLKENVERDTEGRVVFEFTPGAVAPPARNWDHVTSGLVDAAYIHAGFERNRLHLMDIGRLTGHNPSATALGVASWRTYKKHFEAAGEYKGTKLLATYTYTGEQIFTIDKPINSVADIKGLKLRSGNGLAKDIFVDLGAAAIPSLATEIFPMVSKGVVDGMTGSAALAAVLKVDQFLNYGVEYPGAFVSLIWTPILNIQKWESISADDQAIMDKYLGEALTRNVSGRWDEGNVNALAKMRANGVKIHPTSPEMTAEVKQITAKYTDQWLEKAANRGVDGKAALAYFNEQLKAVQAEKK